MQKKKLHEANIILEKTEIAYNAHTDTVSAKEQVIHHQKTIIDNQETIINSLKLRTTTTVDAEADKNGEITNAVLVWIDIQRMTTAENIWKTQALSHFTTDEISTAKNEMWDRCGEHRLGKLIRRQGSSKTKAELDDLAAAFKTLAENETLPSFIASSETLRRTPLFNVDITNNTNDAIATRLKILEETINAAISMNKVFIPKNEKMVDKSTSAGKSNRNDITGSNNALYSDIVVQQQSIRKPIANDENRTKQILGQKRILHGTSHDQSRDMTFAADIDLVAYGVSTKVTGDHLSKFIEDKGIKVLGCVLLTKYEHARTLSYKVTIKACDYEKSQDPSIWPYRIGVRPFRNPKNTNINSSYQRSNQDTRQIYSENNRRVSTNYDNSTRKDNSREMFRLDNQGGIRNVDNAGFVPVNNNKRDRNISDNRRGFHNWNMDNSASQPVDNHRGTKSVTFAENSRMWLREPSQTEQF